MDDTQKTMGRAALAKATGVNMETIRYYERVGLMPKAARTDAGYRVYSLKDSERLNFIRHSKEIGFDTAEIRQLLAMIDGKIRCGTVKELAVEHISTIDAKIEQLLQVKLLLKDMAAECKGGDNDECAIIDRLLHS